MPSALTLAVAQPISVLGDVAANVTEHARMVGDVDARLILFPELSLTGYGMDAPAVDPGDPALGQLVDACALAGSVALVGAPTRSTDGDQPRISMLRVGGAGVEVVYDKMNLGGQEPAHFEPGEGPGVIEVDGWRLGLAICKDNGVPEHAEVTVTGGIDAYLAGVCESAVDRTVQPRRAAAVVERHGVWVAYASFAGPTGGGFADTAGRSAIVDPTGAVRLQLGKAPGQIGVTTLTKLGR